MSTLRQRIQDLGVLAATEERAPRFLGSGKDVTLGGVEYEPLVVRGRDKADSLRLLSATERVVTDVALLVDAVVAQYELLAEQSARIERLEAEVETLRTQRLTTDVMKEVHEALLKAGKEEVEIDGFDFQIETADSYSDTEHKTVEHAQRGLGVDAGTRSGTLDIGAVLDAFKGANLAGEASKSALESVRSRLTTQSKVERSAARKASGRLTVKHVGSSRRDR